MVAPLVVIAVALWVSGSRRRLMTTAALGGVGVIAYGYLTIEALAGRLTVVVDFFETSNPLYRSWSTLLPDYRHVSGGTWVLHALWAAVAVCGVWWGSRAEIRRP